MHKTLKENRLKREDFDEFVELFMPEDRSERGATWRENLDSGSTLRSARNDDKQGKRSPKAAIMNEGRCRCFTYDELIARDKTNLDIFWLKDESLEDTENLPPPDVLAAEIVEQLEAALEEFRSVVDVLGGE